MKYLHGGYILFCDQAEHAENGRVNAQGLFDVFVGELPLKMDCQMVIGFGTPFERRQYKGLVVIENPEGHEIFRKEFQANDPNDIYKGHYIVTPEVTIDKEGMWTAKCVLRNYKDETMWDVSRQFWSMVEGSAPPDP
ncbi:MAG: hypothetical protein K2Y39_05485 [Candidatus Obscuribacterales bacterium]|jgi:hypothetical protein|nr:hypothetical protein [Candidatus Obscuribacterales bacterium]